MRRRNDADKLIRIAHYASGPVFRHSGSDSPSLKKFRKVGYGLYSECFYREAARISLDHEARIDKVQEQMLRLCENELGSLQPKHVEVWESILCDIFLSPQMDAKLLGMLDMCVDRGEFESVTVDSTVKPTRPLVGQLRHNKRKKEKRDQAIPYAPQLHAARVVRGASGSVLLAEPIISENIPPAGVLYDQKFSDRRRGAVRYPSADTVNSLIEATMRNVFPNLRRCA